jgi:hypothetical protein
MTKLKRGFGVSALKNGVLCDTRAYTVTVFFLPQLYTNRVYQKGFIRSMTKNTAVYLTPLLVIKLHTIAG